MTYYKVFSWNSKMTAGAAGIDSFSVKEEAEARRAELESYGLATWLETVQEH